MDIKIEDTGAGPQVYMGNVSGLLGKLNNIEMLTENKVDERSVKRLKKEGLALYSECSGNLLDLAIECGNRTVKGYQGSITRIIVCTESHWDTSCFDISGLDRLKAELNCQNAHLTGMSFSFCCNVQVAINTAYSILKGSPKDEILVIGVDKCAKDDQRILGRDLSILSDGASSFILSTNVENLSRPLKVVNSQLLSDSSIKNFSEDIEYGKISGLTGLVKFVTHCISLKKRTLQGTEHKEIENFITNNYKKSVSTAFSLLFGYKKRALNVDLISRWAHAFSSDVVLTLNEVYEDLAQGENILMFSSGPQSWGVTFVEKI